MTTPLPKTLKCAVDAPSPTANTDAFPQRPYLLSGLGLLLAVVALGLAVIPGLAFERPLPNPFAKDEPQPRVVEPPPEREGGVTLRFRNLSVNFGGKVPQKEPAAELPQQQPEVTKDPVRWFTIAAVSCALVGLVVSSIGQVRERHTALTTIAITVGAAAITWQYFAIGIAIGAAFAALLIVLAIFGSMVPS